jgi:uncharacterized protein
MDCSPFVLVLIGLATGALTGLTGASGMSILISALLLAGIPIEQVIGLTFAVTLVNSAISLGAYWRHDHVDRRAGMLVAVPAIATVMLGHLFSKQIGTGSLTGLMVICLFLIGAKFLFSPSDKQQTDTKPVRQPNAVLLILLGSGAGFLMGIMGGGGAVFIGAALILLFKMEAKTAIGTSILIMGVAAIPGVVSHWLSQTIVISYAAVILASSIPAAFAASWFANRISTPVVKRALGVYLVLISSLLLYRMLI